MLAPNPPPREPRPESEPSDWAALLDAVEHLAHGLSVFDAEGRLVLANRRFLDLWGLPADLTTPGTPLGRILPALHGVEVTDRISEAPLPTIAGETGTQRREWLMADGRRIEVTITELARGGYVAVHQNVTARRRAEQRLAHLTRHDPLTGLPNRVALREELERHLPRTRRGDEQALLCLDLDRFGEINDTLGHAAGDRLLTLVAERLAACVRDSDVLCHRGADDFTVLQLGAAQPEGSTSLARRLIEAMAEPFVLDDLPVHLGLTIGVAIAPFDGDSPDELVRAADLALRRARAEGRGQFRYFEPSMDARMRERRQLEADLRAAIEHQAFVLEYQPQVGLADRRIVGLEALIRWNHPQRGRVSPADFIPLAEDTGLIIPIGQWVLRQACRDAAQWPTGVGVSVNLSPAQFRSRSLVADVVDALRDADLDPSRLCLEITETVLLNDTEESLAVLHELRRRGVRTAMDDFGTGYSSLGYLRRFPFDTLKIDRSFVRDIETNGDARAIIRAIVAMGRSLGMSTTVEGVETLEQLAVVRDEGCDDAQGYLFSRPRPLAALAPMLALDPPALPQIPSTAPGTESPCTSASCTSAGPARASAAGTPTTSSASRTTETAVSD